MNVAKQNLIRLHDHRVGFTISPTRRQTVSVMRLLVCPSNRLACPKSSISLASFGRGCVKTFQNTFDSREWNENRAPTQISGLLITQAPADFT